MRNDVIAHLVSLLVEHDLEEKRLVNLCRQKGCKPSELPDEEKANHDRLEWLTLDQFYAASKEEGRLAIDIYDNLHSFIELY